MKWFSILYVALIAFLIFKVFEIEDQMKKECDVLGGVAVRTVGGTIECVVRKENV